MEHMPLWIRSVINHLEWIYDVPSLDFSVSKDYDNLPTFERTTGPRSMFTCEKFNDNVFLPSIETR